MKSLQTHIGRSLWAIGLLVATYGELYGSPGTDGAAFLKIPVGAGPAAMGSAYSALATDAYAPVWNPAGLGFLDSTQVAGQHVSYLESINYEFLSVVHPIVPGDAVGFSAQYIGTGDIPAIDRSGFSQGTYSDNFGAYSLAYGHALTDRVSLGITGKLIHIALSDVSANAYTADIGTLWRASDHFNIAGVVKNMGSKLKFLNESDSTPLAFHVGAAYAPSRFWLLSAETVFARTGQFSGRTGFEWRPIEFVGLRAGYRTDTLKELSGEAGLSVGLGLLLWGHELAYAWLPYGDLGNSQYVSAILRFGGAEKRHLIQYQHTKFESDDVSSFFDPDELNNPDVNERYRKKSPQAVQGDPPVKTETR